MGKRGEGRERERNAPSTANAEVRISSTSLAKPCSTTIKDQLGAEKEKAKEGEKGTNRVNEQLPVLVE